MIRKNRDNRDRNDRREEALRPNPRLGYDRDTLGLHLMSREAFRIAESQFRRAVWLNPFEPVFKYHLAWCLYRQNKYLEARQWAQETLDQKEETSARQLLDLIENKLNHKERSS